MLILPAPDDALASRFTDDGYLPLPGLLSAALLARLRAELQRLATLAVRRDFTMACMNDSPRHLTVVGGQSIAQHSSLIPALYREPGLLTFLGRLTGLDITTVHEPVERHVLNVLHQPGDTHGAHIDDYPLALVLFLHAPAHHRDGGLLEYTPHASTLDALGTRSARRAHHRSGDAYLLRSDTTAHRVTPLRHPGLRRAVLNMAYTTPGRQHAVTDSATLLYDGSPEQEGTPRTGAAPHH
ncbi:HalD/BesD family halogenase [Streptomyces sclerotialus]|uniref:HalD/BesD family halogenase n=1 Tax=Streptomyces sclerotialus TaxID=1957 RepID=UPI00068A9949